MEAKNTVIKIDDIEGRYLFIYNEKVKSLIYQYKGCYDYPLRYIFLSYHLPFIKFKYFNYIFVPIPSFIDSDNARGFNHVEEMLKAQNLKYIIALKKIKNIKKSSLNKSERENLKNVFALTCESEKLINQNVCLVDDVITTGSSIKECASLIKTLKIKKLTFLAVSHPLNKDND